MSAIPSAVTPAVLAVEFSKTLRAVLSSQEMEQVIARNQEESNPHVCHSHDFCDANMVMDAALGSLGVEDPDVSDPVVVSLWNQAWHLAKLTDFTDPQDGTKRSIGSHDWALGKACEDGIPVFVDDRQLSYRKTQSEAVAYALEIIARLRADGDYRLNDRPQGFLPPAFTKQ